jgi:ELWxxDGT repeat protein
MEKTLRVARLLFLLFSTFITQTIAAGDPYLVKDIYPGDDDSCIDCYRYGFFAKIDGTIYFSAADGVHVGLWKSDGTEAGTVMVKDIYYSGRLTNVNGMLYFAVNDHIHGNELWKSDGTEAGTVPVKDIFIATSYHFTDVNGTLYFTASDSTCGQELWKSDGTEAGTVLVKDILPGSDGSSPNDLINVNGMLYFWASDKTHGQELWKSDGTEAGTVMVKDIYVGSTSSQFSYPFPTTINGQLYFTATDSIGDGLWKSDGTEEGTVLVAGGGLLDDPNNITDVNGTIYFTNNFDLWKSDGTEAGTVLVKVLTGVDCGFPIYSPDNLTNVNGTLFFTADDCIHGKELWKSDGTDTGTVMVKDIWPGNESWFPYKPNSSHYDDLTNVNGTLYFLASDGTQGGLWKSDGTEAGTARVSNFGGNRLTNVNEMLYFTANDGIHGEELWALNTSTQVTTTTIPTSTTTTTTPNPPLCAVEAIYGENSEQTELLRKYRDDVLSKTSEGQEIIKTYYKFSFTITKLLKQMPLLKNRAKAFLDSMLPGIRNKVEEGNREQ